MQSDTIFFHSREIEKYTPQRSAAKYLKNIHKIFVENLISFNKKRKKNKLDLYKNHIRIKSINENFKIDDSFNSGRNFKFHV